MPDENERIILLNWLISRSVTRSRTHKPHTVPMQHLLEILQSRRTKGIAIEFHNAKDSPKEDERETLGLGHDFTRLYDITTEKVGSFVYVTMLIKYANMSIT